MPPNRDMTPMKDTGHAVVNCHVSTTAYRNRGIMDKKSKLAMVAQHDLLFMEVGLQVDARLFQGLTPDTTPVFSTFNGNNKSEDAFQYIGRAVSDSQMQVTVGAMGEVLAAHSGGGGDVICASVLPIPAGVFVEWYLRPGGIPVGDRLQCGRIVAALREYNPGNSILAPARLHSMLRSHAANMPIDDADNSAYQAAVKFFKGIRVAAFSMEAARRTHRQSGNSLAELTVLAQDYGLIARKDNNTSEQKKIDTALIDAAFLMRFLAPTRTSVTDLSKAAFKLATGSLGAASTMTDAQRIARAQVGAVTAGIKAIAVMHEIERRRIIGFTTTGGEPGSLMHIIGKK